MVPITVRLRMDTVDNAITKPVHRLEVFTGAGRRRTWSAEDKARIVAEIVASGGSVSAVARRHGLAPQQLFGWRRELQVSQAALSHAEELQFVPAVLDATPSSPPVAALEAAKEGLSVLRILEIASTPEETFQGPC